MREGVKWGVIVCGDYSNMRKDWGWSFGESVANRGMFVKGVRCVCRGGEVGGEAWSVKGGGVFVILFADVGGLAKWCICNLITCLMLWLVWRMWVVF